MAIKTLKAFTRTEKQLADDLLSAKVATMLGRKMEEADWDFVYCHSKKIPITDWSNLHIDINYNGLGVEHKMLRITKSGSILDECGTTKMHPAGTRSIRIPNERDPNKAMIAILKQYCDLIDSRKESVMAQSSRKIVDMRTGWLLWKESLDEFLYFEEAMEKPIINNFHAEWNITPARGARKESKSLWIYENATGKKKYSVTTEAGQKIQPYFDVPSPNDENLYHFKVQGVQVEGGLVKVWLTRSTAKYLELLVGSLSPNDISNKINEFKPTNVNAALNKMKNAIDIAVPIYITDQAYNKLRSLYTPISDEYMFQQLAIDLGEHK